MGSRVYGIAQAHGSRSASARQPSDRDLEADGDVTHRTRSTL